MNPESTSNIPDATSEAARDHHERRRKWRLFGLGLGVRLIGVLLLWAGDGGSTLFRKVLVVAGLILSIGGIAVLRYLLISGFRRKK